MKADVEGDEPATAKKPDEKKRQQPRKNRTNEDRLVGCGLFFRPSVQTLYDGELVEEMFEKPVPGSVVDLTEEIGAWPLEKLVDKQCYKVDPEVFRLLIDPFSDLAKAMRERIRDRQDDRRIRQQNRWGRLQERKGATDCLLHGQPNRDGEIGPKT